MFSMLRKAQWSSIVTAVLVCAWSQTTPAATTSQPERPPQHLRETGLYVSGSNEQVHPDNLAFSPQYPLWSDGARKRRWIYLPPGTAIDASRPDAWEFPPGTRLWKEFALERKIETRFVERLPDGTWRFAVYVWNEDGTDATLAPSDGATIGMQAAPNGRYTIPGEFDCRACHEGASVPVLGFSALQLSSERDPLAPHAERGASLDLEQLVARGLIVNLPKDLMDNPPRIEARSPAERAALGYLHGNCAHCHNDNGAPVPVDLTLAQSAVASDASADRVLRSMIEAQSRFRGHGLAADASLIEPGRPDASVLVARVRSRNPHTQMPPLGTQLVDAEALALLERWIAGISHTTQE